MANETLIGKLEVIDLALDKSIDVNDEYMDEAKSLLTKLIKEVQQREISVLDELAIQQMLIKLVEEHQEHNYSTVYFVTELMKIIRPSLRAPVREISVVNGHVADAWQPPTLDTLQRWRKHEVITYRDWIGVLDMVESRLRSPVRESGDQDFLRHLVDIVWNSATESETVPATSVSDELIAKARI